MKSVQEITKGITSIQFDQSEIDENGTYSELMEFDCEDYTIQCEVIAEVTKFKYYPETRETPEEIDYIIKIDELEIKNIICENGLDNEPPSNIYNELVKELIKYVEI
jgi:hypothetical protein